MSKAYLTLKNFNFREMMNLVSYGTKFPDSLTSSQRYPRACLRRQNQLELEGLQGDVNKHFDKVQRMSSDFYKLMRINNNISLAPIQDKVEFKRIVSKWEQWQEDNYEAHNFIGTPCQFNIFLKEEVRPYCSTSSRYLTYPDALLNFDPFGYYKPRLLSDSRPIEHLPFFEDYPMNDSSWLLSENFPEGFVDTNAEEEALRK